MDNFTGGAEVNRESALSSHNSVRDVMSRMWLQRLGRSVDGQVEDHEKFFECGGDSIGAIGLYIDTEERLALVIDAADFLGTLAEGDFGNLVRLAERAGDEATT
ncbi:acyl carrier protein [Streptomyces sp. NPDC101175]|uniref:acyl carrier protein n=1 Tax=Streptomyces sp. NPDC101175 TaxID=3366123 RepID=UPI0038392435